MRCVLCDSSLQILHVLVSALANCHYTYEAIANTRMVHTHVCVLSMRMLRARVHRRPVVRVSVRWALS